MVMFSGSPEKEQQVYCLPVFSITCNLRIFLHFTSRFNSLISTSLIEYSYQLIGTYSYMMCCVLMLCTYYMLHICHLLNYTDCCKYRHCLDNLFVFTSYCKQGSFTMFIEVICKMSTGLSHDRNGCICFNTVSTPLPEPHMHLHCKCILQYIVLLNTSTLSSIIILYYSYFLLLCIAAFCRYSLSLVASITFAIPFPYVPAFLFMSTLHSYNSQ